MATYGNNPAMAEWEYYDGPGHGGSWSGTMPAGGGTITSVSFYADGYGSTSTIVGSVTGYYTGGGVSCGAGSASVNGQAWHTDSGGSPVYVAGGTPITLTFRNTTNNVIWSTNGAGTPGIYITYTPASPPSSITYAATSVTTTTAVLNGDVLPNGLDTNAIFSWATTAGGAIPGNGNVTPNYDAGAGASWVPYSATLTGLTPATTYYFCAFDGNAAGIAYGTVLSFTTAGVNAPTLLLPATAAVVDCAAGFATTWTYNGGLTQLSYAFRRNGPLGYQWWQVGTGWVGAEVFNTSAVHGLTFTAAQWIAADDGLAYSWNVATKDSSGEQPYAGVDSTLTCEGAPFAPSLTSPGNNAYPDLANLGGTFSWTHNPDGAAPQNGYIFKRVTGGVTSYWTGSAFQSSTITVNSAVSSITFGASLWVDGNTYTWTVGTVDAGGTSPFASSFTVYPTASPVVTILSPVNGGTNTSANPNCSWSIAEPGAQVQVTYTVLVYTAAQIAATGFVVNGGGPNVFNSGQVASSATAIALTGLPAAGSVTAYVQVTDTDGTASAWATSQWTQAVVASGQSPNAPALSIQIGFAATASLGTNFILNSATQGKLNSATYTLGGSVWVDVTQYAIGQVSISRGRSRETDQYTTGTLSFELYDPTRQFDPANTASPYYPNVAPRTPVAVYLAGIQIFGGYVENWDVDYQLPNWESVKVSASDSFSVLANTYIVNWTAPQQSTGARLSSILALIPPPGFPGSPRIAAGNTLLQPNIFGAATSGGNGDVMLDDMQSVSASEWGFLFIDRTGALQFMDRYAIIMQLGAGANYATFSDVASDLNAGAFPYTKIGMVSATLLLYNQVNGTRNSNATLSSDSPVTQQANSATSQAQYLMRAFGMPTLENNTDADVLALCNWVLSLYQQPEIRYDTMTVNIGGIPTTQVQTLAALDIPQVVTVRRTPPGGGTPPVISLLSYIDKVGWDFDIPNNTYNMSLAFGSAALQNYFVLNSATYGVLNTSELAY